MEQSKSQNWNGIWKSEDFYNVIIQFEAEQVPLNSLNMNQNFDRFSVLFRKIEKHHRTHVHKLHVDHMS